MHVTPIDDTGANCTWVVQRVPDGHVVPIMNEFIIREVDFNDSHNFKWADNLRDVAWSWGVWEEGQVFDFVKIFAAGDYLRNERMWRAFKLVRPDLDFP